MKHLALPRPYMNEPYDSCFGLCAICHTVLGRRERVKHHGRCARQRKTELQRLRRWRRRQRELTLELSTGAVAETPRE